MTVFEIIGSILLIITCVLVTVTVLFQSSSKADGISALTGKSASASAAEAKSNNAKLARMTKYVAIAFGVLALLLNVIAFNKSDLLSENTNIPENAILVSAKNNTNVNELKGKIAKAVKVQNDNKRVVGDLLQKGDVVVLVTPIDSAAPKGRLILPQQMTIRDILDSGAIPVVTRETELKTTLEALKEPPKMVITDSQAFGFVSKITGDIPLTSFSILMARYKGSLESAIKGAEKMKNLNDGDAILISEGCTHHRQCGDIGTQKLPKWLKEYSGKELNFKFTSGKDFPEDLTGISLVIHCGGCMLTEREMQYRRRFCEENNVPITNYGTAIAQINGILEKSLRPVEL